MQKKEIGVAVAALLSLNASAGLSRIASPDQQWSPPQVVEGNEVGPTTAHPKAAKCPSAPMATTSVAYPSDAIAGQTVQINVLATNTWLNATPRPALGITISVYAYLGNGLGFQQVLLDNEPFGLAGYSSANGSDFRSWSVSFTLPPLPENVPAPLKWTVLHYVMQSITPDQACQYGSGSSPFRQTN